MWKRMIVFVSILILVQSAYSDGSSDLNGFKVFEECLKTNESYTCLSDKAARAVERAMDRTIPFLEGMSFIRNNETVSHRQARLLGFERLNQAIQNFFQTHVVSLELGGARKMARGGGGDEGFGGFGGGGGFNKKAIKKEQKYVNYAFMVLLGIFGLTGPLVMKVLALMAAKAILAAKAALIIVGSVALKKLFEKDHPSEPAIKVHTINHDHEDDHDRIGKYGYTGYGLESDNPYASYYDDYYNKNFASSSHKRR